MVYIFAGENHFAIKQAVDAIIAEFIQNNGDLAVEKIYGPESSPGQIENALTITSLFSEKKLVVVDQLSTHKNLADNIEELLKNLNEDIELVLVEPSMDKRSAYYKFLKKQSGFHEELNLDENSLAKWVVNYSAEQGGQINMADARYLIFRVGLNQANIKNELTKLLLYAPEINRPSIDLLTEQIPTSSIFSLVDTAFSGSTEKALRYYDEQRMLGKEAVSIFGMLVWQMHLVAVCSSSEKMSVNDLARITGLKSFNLSKAKIISDKMGKHKVKSMINLLTKIEKTSRQKSYNMDDAMKLVIAKFAY